MHWAKVQILLHAVGSFTLNQEKTVPGWYFASWRDFLIKTTWNIDAFADKQRLWEDWTNWTYFKFAFMILCVWYLNNICISSMLGFHNAIHDYYALKQRPGSEGCWHILSAKTFDFQLSWPHTLLHPPFHIEIIPVWITGPWCKMLIKPNCNHKVGKTYGRMCAAFVLLSFRMVVLNFLWAQTLILVLVMVQYFCNKRVFAALYKNILLLNWHM